MDTQKWEYKALHLKTPAFSTVEKKAEDIGDLLNDMGVKGWELSSITHDSMHMWAFLKRPL